MSQLNIIEATGKEPELRYKRKGFLQMLSIEVCRKYLGKKGQQMTDEQVKAIREALYQVGNILVKQYLEAEKDESSNLL